MHNNQTSHAKRIFAVLGALAALALSGCVSPTIINRTLGVLAPSPTQTYKITASVKPSASNFIPDSETVQIMIGQAPYPMTKVPNSDTLYEFDYKAPPGVTQFAYYFLAHYNTSDSGIVSLREDYSTLQHAVISDQISSVAAGNTAAAGASVSSANTAIPWGSPASMESSASANVAPASTSASGALNAGSFGFGSASSTAATTSYSAQTPAPTASSASVSTRQDGNDLTVSPTEISIHTGSNIVLKFITPTKVTGSPLLIDVTTDIPDSVIMPEVYVNVGRNVGSVILKGGKPGKGNLYVKAAGYAKTLTIPITVK